MQQLPFKNNVRSPLYTPLITITEEAHEIFNAYSIHEVIDLGRKAATVVLMNYMVTPSTEWSIDRYLGDYREAGVN